jgi:hypothetical protein
VTNFKRPILDKSGTYDFLLVMTLEEMLAAQAATPDPESPVAGIRDRQKAAQALAERPWLASIARGDPPLAPYRAQIGRRPDGTFEPGMSPNPGGRPLAVTKMIEYLTGGGEALVAQAYRVVAGELLDCNGEPYTPSLADQAEARKWLADRLWGKSVDRIAVEPAAAPNEEIVDAANVGPDEWKILARARVARALKNTLQESQDIEDGVIVSAE